MGKAVETSFSWKNKTKPVRNMISISFGLVYIVLLTNSSNRFFSLPDDKKENMWQYFPEMHMKEIQKKIFQFRDGTNDQTEDFCFGNGRIDKPFTTTAAA